MQFTFHQVITFIAVTGGTISLYTGIAGSDILLFFCGAAIVIAATVPNRKVDIGFDLKGFKFRMRLVPETIAEPPIHDNQLGKPEKTQDQLPVGEDQ